MVLEEFDKIKWFWDQCEKFLEESNAIEGVYDKESLEQAQVAWRYLLDQKILTTGVLLKTHKILMLNQPLMPDQKGYFRKVPVWIGGREGIQHELLDDIMAGWVKKANNTLVKQHRTTAEREKEIINNHIEYEKIHPFVDGNGRTGRMFLNWQRVQVGLSILVIKESEKQEYYKWFD